MTNHLLLIDASGFAHRAYHARAATYREDGLPTWAITGFIEMMWYLLGAAQHDQPTHAVAVFDAPGLTFRKKLFPAYKANRPARDEELVVQLPYMRHAAETMGITPMECAGFEADDVIATLALDASTRGCRVTIVSSDKDFEQLLDERVEIIDPVQRRRITTTQNRRLDVNPGLVPDMQALCGDAVDNIPGIRTIGHGTAAGLVRAFGTVEAIHAAATSSNTRYAHLFAPNQRLELRKPGALEALMLYRTLASLRCDTPARFGDDLVLRPILRESVEGLLDRLGAGQKFDAIFGIERLHREIAPPFVEGLMWAWWMRAVTMPSRDGLPSQPQCGFYRTRLTSGGPWVPARIWWEFAKDPFTGEQGPAVLKCEIAGALKDPVREWERLAPHPVTREKYDYMVGVADWARRHAPDHPEAQPNKKIDWLRIPLA